MEDFSMKLDAKIVLNEVPSLDQLKEILQNELKNNFDYVNVDAVDCPDFRESPFGMTGSGFGKDVRIAEVGGHQNLYPVPRTDKFFNLKKIAETCEMPNAFIFGPGAGPFHVIGQNCEMVANANFTTSKDNVSTKITKIKSDNGEADQNKCNYESQTINNADFALMANLAVTDDCTSRGNKVLRINVRKRIGAMNYVEAIRKALIKHNPNKLISLAGVFLVKSGQVRMHVMPKFPEQPFKSSEQLETEWLQFFPMSSPLVCTSVIHADEKSCTEHKLRAEHTHCYSNHGDGGHYHYDITEDIIEYDGYFTTANTIYRIDMN